MYYDRQMIVEQDLGFHLFIFISGLECQNEVYFAFDEHLHQLRHRLVEDVQLYVRVLFHERQYGLREDRAEGVGYADVQGAGKLLFQVADVLLTGIRCI